jgi:hypothetical protein
MGLQEGLKSVMVASDAVLNVRANKAGSLTHFEHHTVSSSANSTRPSLELNSRMESACSTFILTFY